MSIFLNHRFTLEQTYGSNMKNMTSPQTFITHLAEATFGVKNLLKSSVTNGIMC